MTRRAQVELSGEMILQLLSRSGMTLGELHERLSGLYGLQDYDPMPTWNMVLALVKLELLIAENMSSTETEEYLKDCLHRPHSQATNPVIRVTPTYVMARAGMEMHPIGLVRDQSSFSSLVFPLFGAPRPAPADVFALMEFNERCSVLYDAHIKKVVAQLGLSIVRADEMLTNNTVIHDVWSGLFGAAIVIADCTDRNPNVFYEIGIAHTLGRPVILTLEKGTKMPFDLNHIRYIVYESTVEGMAAFDAALTRTIHTMLETGSRTFWV